MADMSQAEKLAYDRGFRDALAKRQMFITVADEMAVPIEWSDFTDENERENIAAIVSSREYQECFRHNLRCQAMLKWRQGRLFSNDPAKMKMMMDFGNLIMELVDFYDHAGDPREPTNDENADGYSSSLSEL
jgi:hypothetical protein